MNISHKTTEHIKYLRRAHDMQAVELAEKIGITKSSLCNIEHNRRKPCLELIEKCCVVFKISMSEFFEFKRF